MLATWHFRGQVCLFAVTLIAGTTFGQPGSTLPSNPPPTPVAPGSRPETYLNAAWAKYGSFPASPVSVPLSEAEPARELGPNFSTVFADQHPVIGEMTADTAADPARAVVEFFPTSLLWEPKLADKQDPRLSLVFSDTDSFFSRQTADPSIGLTAGLIRIRPERLPCTEFQLDAFAVAHLRYSRVDEAIAQNYRAGVPITFRSGNWVGKFGYEHTSTQLGDELFDSGRRGRITFERDEFVGGLGYLWRNQLRPYGQVGYAYYRNIPGEPERWRYDVGFDWFKRQDTGKRGQPFAAVNAAFNPEVDYDVSMNYQVGWMWRTEGRRLSQFRVYAEFYDGSSPFGQLFNTRERYAGFGIALDY